ncbi:MAG: hypothetical protein DI635_13570 [Pseudoxanthomonas suwonensis]|nr:MAG: hypothetical protein DI635_13570 [Pseudoxanthomonas suwonensis]
MTVYGSCVARDAVDLAGADELTVTDYIARQSLLSAGHDATARFPQDATVRSAFQRRMMLADFAGDLDSRLTEAAKSTDVLLWDLTDERHGVHIHEDGSVVTRSVDVVAVPEVLAAVEQNSRHLPFGTDEHYDLWAPRATAFAERLEQLDLMNRTLVLQIPWALVTVDGLETPLSMGVSAVQANEVYRRYYAHLRDLGFQLFEMQPLGVLADPSHRWGLAPFHYTQDVYEKIVEHVLQTIAVR